MEYFQSRYLMRCNYVFFFTKCHTWKFSFNIQLDFSTSYYIFNLYINTLNIIFVYVYKRCIKCCRLISNSEYKKRNKTAEIEFILFPIQNKLFLIWEQTSTTRNCCGKATIRYTMLFELISRFRKQKIMGILLSN